MDIYMDIYIYPHIHIIYIYIHMYIWDVDYIVYVYVVNVYRYICTCIYNMQNMSWCICNPLFTCCPLYMLYDGLSIYLLIFCSYVVQNMFYMYSYVVLYHRPICIIWYNYVYINMVTTILNPVYHHHNWVIETIKNMGSFMIVLPTYTHIEVLHLVHHS